MPNPATTPELIDLVRKSGIHTAAALDQFLADADLPPDPVKSAAALVKRGMLTPFQAKLLLNGRYRGFKIGAYVIREQIGQGGMGTVYLAEHAQLRRRVAIKVLATTAGDNATKLAVERFLREARAAAALDHPNIVRIHDVGQHGEIHYLVMEYVDGQTLDKVVQAAGPIACGRAVEYITQAAAGLQHAYEKGFVHRDIKPANLMLAKDGTVKILDMGLARSLETNDKLTEVLDKGAVVGTADYISPEQAMNSPDLDIRADIYSLGASFFTLVAGRPPFDGNTTQKLLAHQMKSAPSLATIDRTFPTGLAEVVARMLAKKPEGRYQTPAEVITALGPWLPNSAKVVAGISRTDLDRSPALRNTLNEVVTGSTKNLTRRIPGPAKRSKLPLVVGLAVAGLAAVGVGVAALAGAFSSGDAGPRHGPPAGAGGQAATAVPPATQVVKPAPVGYRLNLASQKPFTVSGTCEKTGEVARDVRLVEAKRTGSGDFPPGWAGVPIPFGAGTEAEFTAAPVDGRMALGMRYLKTGKGNPALLAPDLLVPTGPCRVRFEYKTAVASDACFLVRFRTTSPGKPTWFTVGDQMYPGHPDGWRTVEITADLKGAATGYFEFHMKDKESGQTLWVRAFEFGDPPPDVGSPPPASVVVFDLDLARQPKFTATGRYAGQWSQTGLTGEGKPPANWAAAATAPGTDLTFAVADIDGSKAIGVTATAGPGAAGLVARDVLVASGKARATVEYHTAKAAGPVQVLYRPAATKGREAAPPFVVAALPAAPTGWAAKDIEFNTRGSNHGELEFVAATGPGAAVWVRGLTVWDQVGPPEKRLVRLNLSAAQPYRQQAVKVPGASVPIKVTEESGPGKMPPEWYRWIDSTDTVAEYTVDGPPGKMALGVRAVKGSGAILLTSPKVVTADGNCWVRLLYQTDPGTHRATLNFRPDGGKPVIKATDLPDTHGQWRWATAKLEKAKNKDASSGVFQVTLSADEPGAVRLREFIVSDPDQPAN